MSQRQPYLCFLDNLSNAMGIEWNNIPSISAKPRGCREMSEILLYYGRFAFDVDLENFEKKMNNMTKCPPNT